MEKRVKTLKIVERAKLVDRLLAAGYAFAIWRMPSQAKIHFIISLDGIRPTHSSLSEMDQGFVINLFEDNHPIKPYHLPAHLLIEEDNVKIDPCVSATAIDQLVQAVEHTLPTNRSGHTFTHEVARQPFESMVAEAIKEIKKGAFEKIVLSRYQDMELSNSFAPWPFFNKISDQYPHAFCSLTYLPGKGLWMGASPELLLSDNSERFKTIALAGTKKLEDHQHLKDIAWTHKEIEEQALVSRYIINCFKKIRLREFHEHGPKTIKSGNLAHLKTTFEVKYSEVAFENLADQMLELLHPTSAVCGMPIDQTKPWIKEKELYDREFYAGFLGPVNFEQSTDLFVNLRCMKIQNNIARLYAGAGITEDSIPKRELEETEMKLNILKRLL